MVQNTQPIEVGSSPALPTLAPSHTSQENDSAFVETEFTLTLHKIVSNGIAGMLETVAFSGPMLDAGYSGML